jgi:hypothetical protein
MLPPFIIDEIRKREERQSHQERPVLELPLPMDDRPFEPSRQGLPKEESDKPQRGVIIVDL